MARAWPPASSTSRAAPSRPAWPRAIRATRAPRCPNRRAVARPIPALAPVTTTVWVSMWVRLPVNVSLSVCCGARHPDPGLRDDQDGAGRLTQHVLTHAAQQCGCAAASGQHEELRVGFARDLDQVPP